MSETNAAEPKRRWGCLIALAVVSMLFLAVILVNIGMAYPIEILFHALCGWILYLVNTLPKVGLNVEMMLCGLGALGLAVWLAHSFLRWFRTAGEESADRKPWPLSAPLACTALLLLMFGAAIAMAGIVHQTAWLMRDRLVETSLHSRSRGSRALMDGRQIFMALRDASGDSASLPANLDEAFPILGLSRSEFEQLACPGRDGDRWLYFGNGKSIGDPTPMLVSPKPIGGRWIVVFANGSGEIFPSLRKVNFDLPFHPAPALDSKPAGGQ